MSGLLIDGRIVEVRGVAVIGPHDAEWSHLDPGDCKPRYLPRPQLYVLHKTLADDPERIIDGRGQPGANRRTAEYWQQDPRHSGAHLVTGHDGSVACLADLVRIDAYDAGNNEINERSVGHETCETVGGWVYSAALAATVETCLTACSAIGIQWQVPKLGSYTGHPYARLAAGGANVVGIIGHCDVSEQRNVHDPGKALPSMIVARGADQFDIAAGEDLDVWSLRLEWLKREGWYHGNVDGIPGPMTVAALKLAGFPDGIWARHRETVERLPIPDELLR